MREPDGLSSQRDDLLLSAAQRELASGRQDAFERILYKYEKLIYHIAYRYFNNPDDAMDLSQEAAINLYKGLPRVKLAEGGTLKSWICAITANACTDELRKRKKIETVPLPEEDITTPAVPSAEETAEYRERATEIADAIAKLPEEWRTLIILREFANFTYEELADATGVGINTVKSRLSRARSALRKMLKPPDG